MAPMIASTASPLTTGSRHEASRQGALVLDQLAPKSGSAGAPEVLSCSLNSRNDNVRIPNSVRSLPTSPPPHSLGRCRRSRRRGRVLAQLRGGYLLPFG